jgi:dTDP-4-amino-4,6-dideoxygalactose transaminase
MQSKLTTPSKPLFVARPLLPRLSLIAKQLVSVWATAWLSNFGDQHQELEQKLQQYLGVKHLSLVNNGTLGLLVALKALNITGEVVTTPFTFPATVHVLTLLGLKPVFADVDPATGVIDPVSIEKVITKKTTAILAVHVYGFPCDVKAIAKIARKHNLKVIYDAAHAFGVRVNGQPIGTYGDITMFSFHPTKLFHTGEGGALATSDKNTLRQLYLWKNFGIVDEETVILPGINAKMSEIQAALGLVVFDHIKAELQHRQRLYQIYQQGLARVPGITFLSLAENITPSYQYAVIKVNTAQYGLSRDQLFSILKKRNFFTRKYFYPLCSTFPHYRDLPSAQPKKLPVATQLSESVLSLPFHSLVTPELARQLVNHIRQIGVYARR